MSSGFPESSSPPGEYDQISSWGATVKAFRLFTSYWLAGWFLKAWFYAGYLFSVLETGPWGFDFFPLFFQSPRTAQLFYVLPVWSIGVFVTRSIFYFRFSAWLMIFSSAVLAVHQDTYNDATFVTSFWSGAWALWLVSRRETSIRDEAKEAKTLAALIIGMIFAGGFVGKMTGRYWDGTVLANMFGAYEAGPLVEWIKHALAGETQAQAFRALSWLVILCEGLLALAPVFPYPFLIYAGVPMLLSFALTNTVWIYSVLMCLLGMIFSAGRPAGDPSVARQDDGVRVGINSGPS